MLSDLKSLSVFMKGKYAMVGIGVCILVVMAYVIRPFFVAPGYVDESYQALCVGQWKTSPVAMFLFWQGHLWTVLFGDSYLSLRMLSALITVSSFTVSCGYLGFRTGSWRDAVWMFALCGSLGLIEAHLMYNWDVAPALLYSLCAILSVEYAYRGRLWVLCLLAVTVCLVGLSRIQLCILFPVYLFYVWRIGSKSGVKLKLSNLRAVIFAVVYLLAFGAVSSLMCGSPIGYIQAFASQNIITGHSLYNLGSFISIPMFFLGMSTSQQFVGIWVVLVAVIYTAASIQNQKNVKITVLLVSIIIMVGIVMSLFMYCDAGLECGYGSTGLSLMTTVLFLPVVGNVLRGGTDKHGTNRTLVLCIIWLWFVVPSLGSDNFMAHFNAYGLLPIAVAVIVNDLTAHQKSFLRNLLFFAMVAFGIIAGFRTCNIIANSDQLLDMVPKMQGLHVNKGDKQKILEVCNVTTVLDSIGCGDKVHFDGERYLFTYTLQKAPVYDLHSFHPLDREHEINRRKSVAREYDAWLFLDVTNEDIAGVDSMLVYEGFVCVENRIWLDLNPDTTARKGMILFLREPFASRYRAITGK